jgi:hypothetical protein
VEMLTLPKWIGGGILRFVGDHETMRLRVLTVVFGRLSQAPPVVGDDCGGTFRAVASASMTGSPGHADGESGGRSAS